MKNETAVLDVLEARLAAGEVPTDPESIKLLHPELRVGDNCPGTGCPGRLYDTKAPAPQV